MNAMTKSVGVVVLAAAGVLGVVGGTVIATPSGKQRSQGVSEETDRLVRPMKDERVENLGKEYQLLGRTGKPFGEMSSIVAWISGKQYKSGEHVGGGFGGGWSADRRVDRNADL